MRTLNVSGLVRVGWVLGVFASTGCGLIASNEEEPRVVDEDDGGAGGSRELGSGGTSGGTAGAAPVDPCEGITAKCAPGQDVCHPTRGRVTACLECGIPDDTTRDEECFRSLSADAESGYFCALRGESQISCWHYYAGARNEWTAEAPSGALSFTPADDSSAFHAGDLGPAGCFLLADGGVSCRGLEAPQLEACTAVVVLDQPRPHACALCDGAIECFGGHDPEIELHDVTHLAGGDGQILWIRVGRLGSSFRPDESPVEPAVVQLFVTDDGVPCTLHDDGVVRCDEESSGDVVFRRVSAANLRQVCGVDDAGALFCGALDAPDWKQAGSYVDVRTSGGVVCALTQAGLVECSAVDRSW